ncbi:MAG: hypothetical protein RLZZ367_2220 [Bacteroidota bacterium]
MHFSSTKQIAMSNTVCYCASCTAMVINQNGNVIKEALRLTLDTETILVCVDCCRVGLHKSFEEKGYKQQGYVMANETV